MLDALPNPIVTAPHIMVREGVPEPMLLFCPEEGGWMVGVWWQGRWRLSVDRDHIVTPTHWAKLPNDPGDDYDA